MQVIYAPRGRAAEYAPLALNIYQGRCPMGCRYCYVPAIPGQADKWKHDQSPKKNILERVESDCQKLQGSVLPVLLSFVGDVYPLDSSVTRDVLLLLAKYDIKVVVLTKAPGRAIRDVSLFREHGWWMGTTLTAADPVKTDRWEPNAPRFSERVGALSIFKDQGVHTWVSLEPVLYPHEALTIIDTCSHLVDHWKVGKVNAHRDSTADVRRIEKNEDWGAFLMMVKGVMSKAGITRTEHKGVFVPGTYYIKKSLQAYEQKSDNEESA